MGKHNDGVFKNKFLRKQREDRLIGSTYIANLAVTLLILLDKFDFTPDMLEQFVDYCADSLDSYEKGYLTFDDIAKTIKEETGIELRKKQ